MREYRRQNTGDRSRISTRLLWVICLLFPIVSLLAERLAWAADDPVALFEAGKFEEAKQAFVKVVSRDPDDPVAMYYLGRLSTEGAQSRRYFTRLLQKYPRHSLADDAQFELAETDFADPAGLYLSARSRFRQLLAEFPDSPHTAMAYYRIGLTFLVVNQPDSAIAAFDFAQGRNDPDVIPQARLGTLEALLMKGQKDLVLQQAEIWMVEGAGDVVEEVRDLIHRLGSGVLPPTEKEGKFWVRVGVFENARNVAALKKRLEDAGFGVVSDRRVGAKQIYVFAGPYVKKADAERDRKRISERENLSCVVEEKP